MNRHSLSEMADTFVDTPTTPQSYDVQTIKHDGPSVDGMPSLSQNSNHSSLTPPPSSQAPHLRQNLNSPIIRPSTPGYSVLSSPPTTILNVVKRDSSANAMFSRPTTQQMENADTNQLREMLNASLADNVRLAAQSSEARTSAAHYKLQHNLLSIETEEAAKRMEVEHDMTRREVDILQMAGQSRESSLPSQDLVDRMKVYCHSVDEENAVLNRRLEKAFRVIEMKDEQLLFANEEKHRLLNRIRENRAHVNLLRSPGGLFHAGTPKVSSSYPATPQQQYRATPKHTPATGRSARPARDHSQEPFAALLLADRVLSQENNSVPSTPVTTRRALPRTPMKHSRGSQSLSSLLTTPGSTRPMAGNSSLLPSAQFTSGNMRNTPSQPTSQQRRERRRKSRDSTISASDAEEIARAAMAYRDQSEDLLESQASATATEMLRIDPRESFEVLASRNPTPTPAAEKSGLLQAKIFGSVIKPLAEKRKQIEEDFDIEYTNKKLRAGSGAIGLGIDLAAHR